MAGRIALPVSALLTVATIVLTSSSAVATIFKIDDFSVELNGNLMFADTFSDGTPPPSGPQFNVGNPANTSAIYGTTGTMLESGGKGFLDAVNNGQGSLNVENMDGKVVGARLNTSITDATLLRSMNGNDTFKVSAVYDLSIPGLRSEDYRTHRSRYGCRE